MVAPYAPILQSCKVAVLVLCGARYLYYMQLWRKDYAQQPDHVELDICQEMSCPSAVPPHVLTNLTRTRDESDEWQSRSWCLQTAGQDHQNARTWVRQSYDTDSASTLMDDESQPDLEPWFFRSMNKKGIQTLRSHSWSTAPAWY